MVRDGIAMPYEGMYIYFNYIRRLVRSREAVVTDVGSSAKHCPCYSLRNYIHRTKSEKTGVMRTCGKERRRVQQGG